MLHDGRQTGVLNRSSTLSVSDLSNLTQAPVPALDRTTGKYIKQLDVFLRNKLQTCQNIEFNMTDVLGHGGEALVVSWSHLGLGMTTSAFSGPGGERKAIKIIPYDDIDSRSIELLQEAHDKFEKFENVGRTVQWRRFYRNIALCSRQCFSHSLLMFILLTLIFLMSYALFNILNYINTEDHGDADLAILVSNIIQIVIFTISMATICYGFRKEIKSKLMKTVQYFMKCCRSTTPVEATQNQFLNLPNLHDFEAVINVANMELVLKCAEFECAGIKHENVMQYENVTLDKIGDMFAYVAGKDNRFYDLVTVVTIITISY